MTLLLAMMSSPSLQLAASQLPSLLAQVADPALYAHDARAQQADFLNRLLAEQPGAPAGTGALERFAQDVLKLAQGGSTQLAAIGPALVAATMEYYYFAGLADTTAFINPVAGGISFDLGRIPAASDARGQVLLLNGVRDLVTAGSGDLARAQAEGADVWTIQSGDSGLTTAGRAEGEVQIGSATQSNVLHGAAGNDLLIAGAGDDALYGGANSDVLLGGAGNDALHGEEGDDELNGADGSDVLVGGSGDDHLAGGAGFDIYMFNDGDGFDSIIGGDDDGRVVIDEVAVLGSANSTRLRWIVNPSWHWAAGGKSFDAILVGGDAGAAGDRVAYTGGTLLLRRSGSDDWISVDDYSSGDLGLELYGQPRPATQPQLPDPVRVATQVRELLSSAKQTVSPLILDLDGDGVETVHISAGAHFDHDANGFAEATGWVAPDDGLLVLDRNGNGVIDNGHELFGNNTPLADGSYASDGFAALAVLDGNGDGRISAAEPAYAQLRVWRDVNGNAVAESGELLTLAAAGVSSVATSYGPLHAIELNGNEHLQAGTYTTSAGATRAVEDVWFAANRTDTVAPAAIAVSAAIEVLPDVAGFGNVPSLHQAMQLDASGHLQGLVTQYCVELDASARATLLQSIIFAWTGVQDTAPDSRGPYAGDARALAALEAFAGESFVQGYGLNAGTPNPAVNAGAKLAAAYARLTDYVQGQLMAQTHLRPLYESVAVALAPDWSSVTWDVSATLLSLRSAYDSDPQAGEAGLKAFAASLKQDDEIGAQVLAALRAAGDVDGTGFERALVAAAVADVVSGTSGADYVHGGSTDDLVLGRDGADTLSGGAGDDLLEGGGGDDVLRGDSGSDTYLFGRGSGLDTVENFDMEAGRSDIIELHPDVLQRDISLSRSGDDLVVSIVGSPDQLIVRRYFQSDTASGYAIDGIRFASGAVWDRAEINNHFLQAAATDGADVLQAFATAAVIRGRAGNDSIAGSAQDDFLYGEAGDDRIAAGTGDDTLAGGTGADTLAGGAGNNTYLFARGDGQDTISSLLDTTAGRRNTLAFGDGIAAGDLILRRDNYYDLVISIAATMDSITIRDAYFAASCPIQQLRFADGTTLALARFMEAGDTSLAMDAAAVLMAVGNDAANTITGTPLSNVIDGGRGADVLVGGAGDDTYLVDTARTHYYWEDSAELWNFLDSVVEQSGDGYDTVIARDVYSATLPANTERLIVQGKLSFAAAFDLSQDVRRRFTGNGLDNVIDAHAATGGSVGQGYIGGSGIDLGETVVDGGAGADLMIGPATTTRFVVDDPGDVVVSNAAVTRIEASFSYALAPAFTDLKLTGSAPISGTGNALANVLDGASNTAANVLAGGAGNDTYLAGAGDLVVEAAGAGTDTVRASSSYTLPDNVENLVLTGTSPLSGRGNALDNTISGTTNSVIEANGNNYLVGGDGNDQLLGGGGSDTYADFDTTTGLDTIYDTSGSGDRIQSVPDSRLLVEQLQFSRSGNDLLISVDAADGIRVQSWYANPANVIESLLINNDGLWYGYSGAQVQGRADGVNTAPAVYAVIGAQHATTGQAFAFQFDANAFVDIESQHTLLNAATLADGSALPAWLGFDSTTRTFTGTPPASGAGSFPVRVTATDAGGLSASSIFTLDVAPGAILGTEGDDTLTGDAHDNVLEGLGGNDLLDGAAGADQMRGGPGDDVYVVDHAGDLVTEYPDEGVDEVRSSVSYALPDDVERLSLVGAGAISGTGNMLDNTLTGNGGSNTLTGGAGNDTLDGGGAGTDVLRGGAGDDVYIVGRGSGLTVSENAGEGTDLVRASVTYTLGSNLENLTLTGASAINGTGNTLNNVLRGNAASNSLSGGAGNDTLDGGAGRDSLAGGAGDDVYYVDTSADVTTEGSNAGLDTVNSAVTRTLAANIELLFLTGGSAINGTGNALANLLRGNDANNTLAGGGGVDILEGGAGNDALSNASGRSLLAGGAGSDTLAGASGSDLLIGGSGNDALSTGSGADVIAFDRGDGADVVAASTSRDNTLSLGGGVLYADLLFQKNANDLILKTGGSEQITFTGYYASASNHSIKTLQVIIEGTADYDAASASALHRHKVESFNFDGLVAAFDAARAGNTSLTSWSLTNALVAQYLSGSDTAAIGGDLAYQYGRYGSLASLSYAPALSVLAASGFGSGAQALHSPTVLQDGTPRLN